MTETTVSDHISKEFSFCDPEKKIKNLAADPKSGPKIKLKDTSATGYEAKNPLPFPDYSLNVKLDAPEIEKIFLESNDSYGNASYDSNNFSGGNNSSAINPGFFSL